ncbi:hypothetical protein [Clostridium manihotivorum]|uniref:hypothetical protein n=1 Tax=Clostridium manihotivorum TaxID=2320868 RepID=UPI00196B5447|nr:hypothetical protein [Clostridium manihotivorum]
MEVLSNLESNHYNHIKDIIRDSSEFHIISPFLMESFDIFFHEINKTKVKYIRSNKFYS